MLTLTVLGRSRGTSRRTSTATSAGELGADDLILHRGVGLPRKNFENVEEVRDLSNLLRNLSFSLDERESRLARREVVSPLGERDSEYVPAVSDELYVSLFILYEINVRAALSILSMSVSTRPGLRTYLALDRIS